MTDKQDLNSQTIDITAGGQEFSFNVTRGEYNKYLNAVTANSKIAPSYNFLSTTVETEQQKALLKFLQMTPGAEVQIAGAVLEEYTPDLDIVAKKRTTLVA